ncbi:MAG: hypothetical protein PVF95_14540, partial [bacterium]
MIPHSGFGFTQHNPEAGFSLDNSGSGCTVLPNNSDKVRYLCTCYPRDGVIMAAGDKLEEAEEIFRKRG